ncbi:MAG TPA: hypothetical protein ENI44_02540 [Thermoplasmatales archaeon]|nr:hypothetical protein [Thermoplasmatales archaeon]
MREILVAGIMSLMILSALSLVNPEVSSLKDSKADNSTMINLSINIKKPKEGFLCILDKEIIPTVLGNTLVIGRITVEAEVNSENRVEKVGFYVNDITRNADYDMPYQWLWNEALFGKHVLKAEVYDEKGNKAENKTEVIIFNLEG